MARCIGKKRENERMKKTDRRRRGERDDLKCRTEIDERKRWGN